MKEKHRNQMEIEIGKLENAIRVQGKSRATLKAYRRQVRRFIKFICDEEKQWTAETTSEQKFAQLRYRQPAERTRPEDAFDPHGAREYSDNRDLPAQHERSTWGRGFAAR